MMANTAKYDRDTVVDSAMLLFWEKGFHGTSTRDLQQAVNLRPGSFYAAFGSKEQLFREALHCYSKKSNELLQQSLSNAPSILEGIEAFIRAIVLGQRDKVPSDMCMLVKTIAELTDEQAELVAESKALLKKTEHHISELLREGQAAGELKAEINCSDLAQKVIVQLMGLRTYLRSSDDESAVEKLITEIFSTSKI